VCVWFCPDVIDQGPWTQVLDSQVGTDEFGALPRWYEFPFSMSTALDGVAVPAASRFWRMDITNNYGWQSGTVVVDVQLKATSASQCTGAVLLRGLTV